MRKVFVSYSHRLDQESVDRFRQFFSDERDVFIDKSIRNDIGEFQIETIKNHLGRLIRDSSVTVVLIGGETGGRWWIDWEINYSLQLRVDKGRNGLLGILLPNKRHWIPDRLKDNVPTMGHIINWPSNYRTLANEIEAAYEKRVNVPNLVRPLRLRNSSLRPF